MKISVSIEPVFQNYDFSEGLKLTKSVGINHIEFWSWWDKDLQRIQFATEKLNLNVVVFTTTAGNPGRHELYKGEINYPNVFEAIEETGFDGYMGLEYFPVDDPLLGLWRLMQR